MSITRRLALVFLAVLAVSCRRASTDPYPPPGQAAADLSRAEARAKDSGKILMVIFGGNWCPDCRVLHQRLEEGPVHGYAEKHFEIVGINIGEEDANLDIVQKLGATLKKGVPAAAFIGPDGKALGATNQGELESARGYSAQQVLAFLRKVAEQRVIEKPN
jgi:thioredoxin 1